eukprot:Nk52_evm47s1073 gene=Nk52_evmTU47s1073
MEALSYLNALPDELIWMILALLDYDDLKRLGCSCRRLYYLTGEESLWKNLFKRHGFDPLPKRIDSYNWRQKFERQLEIENNFKSGNCTTHSLVGHRDVVLCIELDEELELIFSGARDGEIIVWCLNTHRRLRTLKNHTHGVSALSVQDINLFSASWDTNLIIWCRKTFLPLHKLPHTDPILSMKVDLGLNLIFTGCHSGRIGVWDAKRRTHLRDLEGGLEAPCCTVDNEGYKLLAGIGSAIYEWDINSIKRGNGNTVKGYAEETKGLVTALKLTSDGYCATLERGCMVLGSKNESGEFKEASVLQTDFEGFRCLGIVGEFIIIGSYDSSIKIWSKSSLEWLHTLSGHAGDVNCLKALGSCIVSGADDCIVNIWSFLPPKETRFVELSRSKRKAYSQNSIEKCLKKKRVNFASDGVLGVIFEILEASKTPMTCVQIFEELEDQNVRFSYSQTPENSLNRALHGIASVNGGDPSKPIEIVSNSRPHLFRLRES